MFGYIVQFIRNAFARNMAGFQVGRSGASARQTVNAQSFGQGGGFIHGRGDIVVFRFFDVPIGIAAIIAYVISHDLTCSFLIIQA